MLIDLLRSGAQASADHPLLVSAAGTVTYADGLAHAESIARGLHAREVRRFACMGSAADMLPLLVASTILGAEACTYPHDLDDAAVADLRERFDHDTLITAANIGEFTLEDGELPDDADASPVLILTTGTTGKPRGARHDWRRLVGAVRNTRDMDARWFLAYNLNQFAGVQVLVHALVAGATIVVPPSNQPREALDAMRDLGVTHASATPTFWRFITGLLDDASAAELGLEQITLGGEAIPAPLLDRLEALFPDARISQVYAANEFGSSVSVRDRQSGLPISVLERGDDADVQMRITDGELEVRSRVGMLGYYGEDDVGDGWRKTGDLVEVNGDRINFVGRTSEIINVGGVKVHPLPIEELVQSIDGVEIVHAYGRKNPVAGQIVAIDVVARAGVDTDDLEDAIRDACDSLQPAARPRSIRFVESVEVNQNKVVRRGTGTDG